MSEDRCVCCGEIVPEGRMVCQKCKGMDEEIIHRMSKRIRQLEETVQYHETTMRMIYADAVAEEAQAREKEITNSVLGNTRMSDVHRGKAEERRRVAERIKSILLRQNFNPERKQ